jgi:SAM-dependent methyltransferase
VTTHPSDFIGRLLAPYGPTRPIPELVVEVNRLFHAIGANFYDGSHPEIHQQLPPVWRDLLAQVQIPAGRQWSLLDFGAGTGFATAQAINELPKGTLKRTVCVDLSSEMLAHCRTRISPLMPQAEFLEDLPTQGPFDLLLTNSVLHHLPDVDAQLARIEPLLAPDAWWVLGHEPSSRFYRNVELRGHFDAYMRQLRWQRFFRPGLYLARLRLFAGDPRRAAARASVAAGLFQREPDPETIDRLVDFGVAHSLKEVEAGRGLDVRELECRFAGRWELVAVRSYSFMGSVFEGRLPGSWQSRCRDLARRFPEDGANFCAVWKRLSPVV